MPLPARFEAKYRVDERGCWRWLGYTSPDGYGRIRTNGKGSTMAHRFAYENLVGPIPPGLTVDHLCRVRDCVNPTHMELTTWEVNISRRDTSQIGIRNREKTHCRNGHPYDNANTAIIVDSGGRHRVCRTCHRERVSIAARQRRGAI